MTRLSEAPFTKGVRGELYFSHLKLSLSVYTTAIEMGIYM